jgi:hypothetical protein
VIVIRGVLSFGLARKTDPRSRTHRDEFRLYEQSFREMRAIVCDASALAADLGTVDLLARLQLGARRRGSEVRLRHASAELEQLLDFVGLGGVLRVEAGGEPEQREERLGVEEERELGDPPA